MTLFVLLKYIGTFIYENVDDWHFRNWGKHTNLMCVSSWRNIFVIGSIRSLAIVNKNIFVLWNIFDISMNILQEYIEYISNRIIIILKIQYEYTIRTRRNAMIRLYVNTRFLPMMYCALYSWNSTREEVMSYGVKTMLLLGFTPRKTNRCILLGSSSSGNCCRCEIWIWRW